MQSFEERLRKFDERDVELMQMITDLREAKKAFDAIGVDSDHAATSIVQSSGTDNPSVTPPASLIDLHNDTTVSSLDLPANESLSPVLSGSITTSMNESLSSSAMIMDTTKNVHRVPTFRIRPTAARTREHSPNSKHVHRAAKLDLDPMQKLALIREQERKRLPKLYESIDKLGTSADSHD